MNHKSQITQDLDWGRPDHFFRPVRMRYQTASTKLRMRTSPCERTSSAWYSCWPQRDGSQITNPRELDWWSSEYFNGVEHCRCWVCFRQGTWKHVEEAYSRNGREERAKRKIVSELQLLLSYDELLQKK
ncbi:unnamed protein product [Hapterophycus canaliculatus]